MEVKAQSPYVTMLLRSKMDGEFKMPPPGINETRYQLAGRNYVKYGVRCEIEGCWFAGGTLSTREAAEKYLADHKDGGKNFTSSCPAPPRRESLPSGLRHVEKLWRELDDVVECMATGDIYRPGQADGMDPAALRGYAKGLAFSIVMMEPVHFADLRSVAKHAVERRKMRLGEIPYVATPTNLGHDAKRVDVEGLHDAGSTVKTGAVKSKPAVALPSEQIQKAIKAGIGSGMFSAADMAETYKLPIELVNQISG